MSLGNPAEPADLGLDLLKPKNLDQLPGNAAEHQTHGEHESAGAGFAV